ncbi:phosphotyrosine protein phosphatase I superfamily [Dipodascopsis tothii]|uniref:phosphotyrosine protein phosphatase I superfamily n=1 Tax=Dipodascopsis tothii TaxID=44089 RepID=UPI0034CE5409
MFVLTVLFVCVHNAGRSQMAAAYLQHLAGRSIDVRSAGSAPGEVINPIVLVAMKEDGIDISKNVPKLLTHEAVEVADIVITMGCGDACPYYAGKRYIDWKVEDPAGQDLKTVIKIRNEIRRRVQELVQELDII